MDENILGALEDIRKLLILALIANGVQATDVADVLAVNKSTITRIVRARKVKKG